MNDNVATGEGILNLTDLLVQGRIEDLRLVEQELGVIMLRLSVGDILLWVTCLVVDKCVDKRLGRNFFGLSQSFFSLG
jgi:hypothetical protein